MISAKPHKQVLFVAACLAVTLSAGTCAAAGQSLSQQWEVSLGPASEGQPFYRSVVCSDGTYYLSDGLGRLIRIDSKGKVSNDTRLDALRGALAVTCDQQTRLVAAPAGGKIITVGQQDDGQLSILNSLSPQPDFGRATSIAEIAKGGYLVLAVKPTGVSVERVLADGLVTSTYPAGPTSAPWSIDKAANGTMVLDRSSGHILYIPESPYTFMRFDPIQGLLDATPGGDADFEAPTLNGLGKGVRSPGDRVMRAAFLPDGDVLVQVVKRHAAWNSGMQSYVLTDHSYLEIFDPSLNRKSTGISGENFGHLQGATPNGDIFFTRISPQEGIHVIKARLTKN